MIFFEQMKNLRPGATNWAGDLRTVLRRLIVIAFLNSVAIFALAVAVIVLALR